MREISSSITFEIKAGETVSPDQTKAHGCGVKYKGKG